MGTRTKTRKPRKPGGRRRPPTAVEVAREQVRRATRELVVASSVVLEKTPVAPGEAGHHEHFLTRLERLSDEARRVASRLYYDHSASLFVARIRRGLLPWRFGLDHDPEGAADERLVLDLEPGPAPGRLVVDARGNVVTCLAAGMVVGSGVRVSFARLEDALAQYEEWSAMHARARDFAGRVDLAAVLERVRKRGWLVPREDLTALAALGPAAGILLIDSTTQATRDWNGAVGDLVAGLAGSSTDALVHAWLRANGALAAHLLLLARNLVEPRPDLLAVLAGIADPFLPMVVGASLAILPTMDGEGLLLGVLQDERRRESRIVPVSRALAVYFGVMLADPRHGPEAAERARSGLARLREVVGGWLSEHARLGSEPPEEVFVLRQIVLEALGLDPGWGPEVESPERLPPPLALHLCQPGGETSFLPMRRLARRLIWAVPRDPLAVFWPAAEIRALEARLGRLDRQRTGTFRLHWVEVEEPARAGPTPGPNAPCPCGSGKKHKRCCGA